MIFPSESSLDSFASKLGHFFLKSNSFPICLELVGDVGAGKTTFTRSLASGLGVSTSVTSPSFTISKRYAFSLKPHERSAGAIRESVSRTTPVSKKHETGELIHYDFYRLEDPGLMAEDLAESLTQINAIVILEWADSIKDLLPEKHLQITFRILEDDSRELTFNTPLHELLTNAHLINNKGAQHL